MACRRALAIYRHFRCASPRAHAHLKKIVALCFTDSPEESRNTEFVIIKKAAGFTSTFPC